MKAKKIRRELTELEEAAEETKRKKKEKGIRISKSGGGNERDGRVERKKNHRSKSTEGN